MYYTGVGARKTPINILEIMTAIAVKMASLGYILRSGGAKGADSAFEQGAGIQKTIFYAKDTTYEAEQIASQFHPAWERCNPYVRKLHGRNVFQILGADLKTPSQYCICWTPGGINTGGTGMAISIAEAYGVTVVNLANENQLTEWITWLNT